MKTIELFSGTKSFSKIAKKMGYSTLTIDFDKRLNPDLQLNLLKDKIPDGDYDILWASPPCTTFSVASLSTHWGGGFRAYVPKTQEAIEGIILLNETIKYIAKNRPTRWYIENPRGVMRKIIDGLFMKHGISKYIRHTITYCQYGDKRMKPTDIWTNDMDWKPKPKCKNGAKCHVRAPRGAKTGTQGLRGARERGRIPPKLIKEILRYVE